MKFSKFFKKNKMSPDMETWSPASPRSELRSATGVGNRVSQEVSISQRNKNEVRPRRGRYLPGIIIAIIIIASGFIFSDTILASLGFWSTDSLNKGLVGHWPLDGAHYNATTNRVDDISGYANHGTNSGATLTNGVKGESNGAMSFNGSSSKINLPVSQFFVTPKMTISTWINANNFNQWRGLIYIRENNFNDFLFIRGKGSALQLGIEDNDVAKVYMSTSSLSTLSWIYITFVQDGTGWKFYLNGSEETFTGTNSAYCTNHLTITSIEIGRSGWVEEYLNASLSDFRIYNRALSPAEITRLYESYKPKLSTTTLNKGLVLDMPLRPAFEKVGSEKVANGGLENGNTGYWSGWFNSGNGASGSYALESTTKKYGSYSLKVNITNDGTTLTDVQINNATVTLESGKKYRLTAWVKANVAGSTTSRLRMLKDGTPYNGASPNVDFTLSTDWQNLSVDFVPSYVGSDVRVGWYFGNAGVSTVYIDSVSVKSIQTADTTPNSNHGAIYGADIRNHGASFNGANNYVNLGTGPKPTNAITMAAWVKPVVVGGSIHNVIDHHNGYEFQERADSYWRTYISLSTAGWISATCTSLTVQANNWYFVSGTYDSATGMIKTYVNGNLCATASGYTGQTIAYSGADKTYIGSRNDGVQRLFNGQISDVKIYSRALSASEILDLYQGKEVSGAILDMPLSDKTGFKDISGNGNNGTNNGATIIGESADFDGTDDYVYESNNLGVPTNGPGSISCWFRLNQSASSKGGDIGIHKELYQESANNFLYIASGGANEYISFVPAINTWYHAVVIWNGDSSSVDIYINNIKYDINVQGGSSEFSALTNFTIGQTGSRYMDGQISDVQIYNRALSATEIASLYAKGRSNAGSTGITTGSLNKGLILDMPLKSTAEKVGNELVSNGDFSNYTGEDFTAWTERDDDNKVTYSHQNNFNENDNVRITWDSNSSVYYHEYIYQDMTGLTIGKTYTASVWARASKTTNLWLTIRSSDSTNIQTNMGSTITTTWTKYTSTFTCTNTTGLAIRLGAVNTPLAVSGDWVEFAQMKLKPLQTADTTPNINHGTIYGATVGANYTTFNGSSNYLNVGSSSSLDMGNEITVSTWVKITGSTGDYQEIICRGAKHHYSLIQEGADGAFSWSMYVNGVRQVLYGGSTYTSGNWYHVVGTYNARTGESRRYVNGILDASGTLATGTFDSGGTLVIGQNGGSAKWFKGDISNLKIYNRALSPAEITSLFDKERGQFGI